MYRVLRASREVHAGLAAPPDEALLLYETHNKSREKGITIITWDVHNLLYPFEGVCLPEWFLVHSTSMIPDPRLFLD